MLSTRLKQWEQEIAEKNLEKGLEKGIERGIEKGIEKGELIGEAKTLKKTLKKMLALKFGPLPDWVEKQIVQADAAQLDQWIGNLLDASNLEEIFK